MRKWYAAALVLIVACSDGERSPGTDLEELRVSTHRGLVPLVPPTGESFSAVLVELVCPLAERSFDVEALGGGRLALTARRPVVSLDAVAKLVRHVDLVSAQVDGSRLLVVLKPEAVPGMLCIENGPYRVASQTPSELLLERRGDVGVPRIRVVSVRDSEEEWRRFVAGEVELVPTVNRSQLRYLQELTSVKLTQVPVSVSIGVTFNVVTVPLELRKAIALGIHRKAIVQALGLDEASAVLAPEDERGAGAALAQSAYRPVPLRLITYSGDADMTRAALVIEENLNRMGFSTSVEELDIKNLVKRASARTYDLRLFLVSADIPAWWNFFRSQDAHNITGYSNPEFDAAADSGDTARVKQIIERDVLIVPLFNVPDIIASDARLCGIEPNLVDLSWLAGVHVCTPNKRQ